MSPFLAWKIHKVIPSSTLTGKVAKVEAATIYVTLGSQAGIEKGQELFVFRESGEIKDPDTGDILASQKRRIAKLTVIGVEDKVARARMVGDFDVELKVGDGVEPASQSKAIAILPFVDLNGTVRAGGQKMSEDLTTGLAQGGINIVERNQLTKVLAELGMQNLVAFDAEKAQKVGKQVGAYAMLLGTMSSSSYGSEANIKLIKVETGEILFATKQLGSALGNVVSEADSSNASDSTGWVSLFNGRDLTGWVYRNPQAGIKWTAQGGTLIGYGLGWKVKNDLFTEKTFWNFSIKCEFMISKGGNSGIVLRGRHEVGILDDYSQGKPVLYGTGTSTSIGLPKQFASRPAGQWQTIEITLVEYRLTVVLNGIKLYDNAECNGVSNLALDQNTRLPGPILLQGHTDSVRFRNLLIKEIK